LDVEEYGDDGRNDQISNRNNEVKFHNVAINDGRTSATNMRLSISYPNYNITDYKTTFQSENVTFSLVNNTLIAELGRLSSGSALGVDTVARCINSSSITDSNNKGTCSSE
jgi:hypothetical protein